MKYTLIINDFYNNAKEQIAKLGHFLSDNQLLNQEGSVILFHHHPKEDVRALEALTELLPVPHIRYVYLEQYIPEICLDYLMAYTDSHSGENPDTDSLFLFVGDFCGNELCTRLSVRTKGCTLTDITSLSHNGSTFLARKKIYSGHILGTFELTDTPCLVSIDKNYSDDFVTDFAESREVFYDTVVSSEKYNIQLKPILQESSFTDSECIVVLGRGLSNTEHVTAVTEAAKQADLPLAGSRPCIMNAWLPMDRLIGVSGIVLKNKLAILLGVSGAPAFYTGVEKCSRIISINSDREASITRKSDLAICGDCTEIFTRFTELLKEEPHES